MKTLDFERTVNVFEVYTLTNEEMINVRGGGGEGDPIVPPPPVKI